MISFKNYVDIVSGVGAGASVRARDLIGRLFTSNNLLPPASFIEFSSAAEVGTYFGTTSAEYLRAVFYFAWVSKSVTRAQKIAFARWVSADVAPRVYGKPATYTLVNFTSVSAGSLTITMGTTTAHQLTGINLSAAASLSDVASALQTAIRAYTAGGTMFTGATVTYDATRKSFNLVGGVVGAAPMQITAGVTGTDIASRLGWLTGSIQAMGSADESITDTLQASVDASNNFGSFLFMDALSVDEVVEAATWNDLQNNMFAYTVPVSAADAETYNDELLAIGGVEVTLSPLAAEYPEMAPMIILAATDYTRPNAVQNYMFQIFPGLTPSVTTDADYDLYNSLRVNFYGRTQTAGQLIDFYQRGTMMGSVADAVDQNTYANEIWLKDYIGSQIMTVLLVLGEVPANDEGSNQIQASIQASIQLALDNGVISVGKTLDTPKQLYITELSDDPLAWQQVQSIGYWLKVGIESYVTEDSRTEYKATYLLIYSKDDAVRMVSGSDVLI